MTVEAPLDDRPEGVLAVRRGPGANCSSIGSAVEILFAITTLGGALYAGLAAALLDAEATKKAADEEHDAPLARHDVIVERARAERFGAWLRLDDGTLVAVDRARAARIGLDGAALWETPSEGLAGAPVAPLEAHVAVTSRCPATCTGCYLDARADGAHASLESIDATLASLAARGVFTVAFGGGEPLLHPAIGQLAERARAYGLSPVVTTSGIGMSRDKAESLRGFAQVNVSYDGSADGYADVRGFDGRRIAERAIVELAAAGVRVGINVVLTRKSFGVDGRAIVETCARAQSLGALEAQLLRYKPAGRAASIEYLAARLTPEQIDRVPALLSSIAALAPFGVRIDCAMVPFLSTRFDRADALEAIGVFGCEAARALEATKPDGTTAPCSFLPSCDEETMQAYRAYAKTSPEPCASCTLRRVCRGGCRVVAAHLEGTPFAPDPECPRVRAHRRGADA